MTMAALHLHPDLTSVARLQQAAFTPSHQQGSNPASLLLSLRQPRGITTRAALQLQRVTTPRRERRKQLNGAAIDKKKKKKPELCTADELHYIDVPGSDWQLALWRYLPSPQAPRRNHPLLLLSGIGASAVGYDLSPENSFARHMADQGYDTWTVELRGTGLSKLKTEEKVVASSAEQGKRFSQMRELSRNLVDVIEGIEGSAPPLFPNVLPLSSGLKDTQRQLDDMARYNWDLDAYLHQDLPAAMEYIKRRSKAKDGKLVAIGHSMGGILLYATLALCCFQGKDSGLASIATLGASLDYTSSRSAMNMLLPLVGAARALDLPAIPLGAMSYAQLPYQFPWLNTLISAQDTTSQPDLFEKLMKMLCTLPLNLLSQLATALQENGLCDREGNFVYKHHLGKTKVPILAIAGDRDSICPPEAVYETVKCIPKNWVTYKVFGEPGPGGAHYAHYDILGGPLAKDAVYPSIVEFLNRHDDVL